MYPLIGCWEDREPFHIAWREAVFLFFPRNFNCAEWVSKGKISLWRVLRAAP